MKQIGIVGSGIVGITLANGLKACGYEVVIGNRSAHTVDGWNGRVGTFKEVAEAAGLIIVTIKGAFAVEVVSSLQQELAGKTVIDTTNPIAETPPIDGVINFFTSLDRSLMEDLQEAAPNAHFVKAFNSVGAGVMVQPQYAEGKPTMFFCGNDEAAKLEAAEVLENLGWEIADMGTARAARAIEPLCMLWCIPVMREQQKTHAFKLLKK